MTKWMWNPCLDVQHENQVNDYVASRKDHQVWNYTMSSGDELKVAGHGSDTDPDHMSGFAADGTHYEVDYDWIADEIANAVGDPSLRFDIKLYMCNAAHRAGKKAGDLSMVVQQVKEILPKVDKGYCFGGQLLSAMKARGYTKVRVAAYHGEIYWAQGLKHKVVCKKEVNPNTLKIDWKSKAYGLGVLVVPKLGYGAARHRREWFTSKPLGTRWL